jgi:hypothetical protein
MREYGWICIDGRLLRGRPAPTGMAISAMLLEHLADSFGKVVEDLIVFAMPAPVGFQYNLSVRPARSSSTMVERRHSDRS